MAIIQQNSRISHHTVTTPTAIFTVPVQEDFTTGTWSSLDLCVSEFGVNEADEKLYIRVGNTVKQIQFVGATGGDQGLDDVLATENITNGNNIVLTDGDKIINSDGTFGVYYSGKNLVLYDGYYDGKVYEIGYDDNTSFNASKITIATYSFNPSYKSMFIETTIICNGTGGLSYHSKLEGFFRGGTASLTQVSIVDKTEQSEFLPGGIITDYEIDGYNLKIVGTGQIGDSYEWNALYKVHIK